MLYSRKRSDLAENVNRVRFGIRDLYCLGFKLTMHITDAIPIAPVLF